MTADADVLAKTNPSTWPFTVLGLNYSIEILLSYNGKIMKWPVERLSENRVKAIFGPAFIDFEQTRDAIIYEANKKGMIDDEMPIKSGIWNFGKKWLVISGKKAVTIEDNVITDLEFPVFNGKLIEFESISWLDWDTFTTSFGKESLSDVFELVLSKIVAWHWKEPSMAHYATAFLFLSPFQQAMRWRPWVYLTGSKGTGKSTFFDDILQGTYGSNTERLDKSTAHATAQIIGNSGKLPIFDEFKNTSIFQKSLRWQNSLIKGEKRRAELQDRKPTAMSFTIWLGLVQFICQID